MGPPLDVRVLHQRTGGNPFFLTEILAADRDVIPATIRDAVLGRTARLSPDGRTALYAAAVIGLRVDPWLLTAVVQADAIAIDEVLAHGILLAQGEWFAFRHELARQAVLDSIPPHHLVSLHKRVLDELTRTTATQTNIARLAHHALAANDRTALLTYAPQAARDARHAGMFSTAAALWERVLDKATALPPEEQAALYEEYALCLRTHPDQTLPILAYRRALELARQAGDLPLVEGRLLVRMATMHIRNGETAEAEKLTQLAFTLLTPLAPSLALALGYKNQAHLRLLGGDYTQAVALAEKSVALARQLGDIYIELSAAEMLGLCWLPTVHRWGEEQLEQTAWRCSIVVIGAERHSIEI